jgi:lipid II:glycine glycyltransferase (peptidoglycan interpeptide bridge formation enzyme)
MMRASVLDNEMDGNSSVALQWEALVEANPYSGMMQSRHWAEFKAKQGLDRLHVVVHDDEELVGGAIFYCATNTKGAGILTAPEGPVLPWQDEQRSQSAYTALLRCAAANAERMQAMALRIEPRIESAPAWVLRGFGRAPFDLVPRETLYIDLSKHPPDILSNMSAKGRYNTSLSGRNGVIVQEEEYSITAVNKFYSVLKQAAQRNDFSIEPLKFFCELGETLCPRGFIKLLFAEHDGETLGTLMLLLYGDRATYLYGGIGNNKRELMAGYALQWAAMQSAKQAGCSLYDMYGFDQFGAPQNPYAKFSRFKRQFGGTVKRFIGAHDYFLTNRLADVLIRAFKELDTPPVRVLTTKQSGRSVM